MDEFIYGWICDLNKLLIFYDDKLIMMIVMTIMMCTQQLPEHIL